MNIYFRFIAVLLQAFFCRRQPLLKPSKMRFTVFPTDIDLNTHMTNSRYLSFMDLGRLYYFAQMGLLAKFLKYKMALILSGVEITFIKPLPPFHRFTLTTELLTWDEKYFYFIQKFNRNGQTHAVGLVRGLATIKGEKIQPERLITLLGHEVPIRPEMPEFIAHWLNLLQEKKSHKTSVE